jgi:hypothetical protein
VRRIESPAKRMGAEGPGRHRDQTEPRA